MLTVGQSLFLSISIAHTSLKDHVGQQYGCSGFNALGKTSIPIEQYGNFLFYMKPRLHIQNSSSYLTNAIHVPPLVQPLHEVECSGIYTSSYTETVIKVLCKLYTYKNFRMLSNILRFANLILYTVLCLVLFLWESVKWRVDASHTWPVSKCTTWKLYYDNGLARSMML